MPNIRIKDIPATASATVNGDFFAVDSNASTRKLNAFAPTFGGDATAAGTIKAGVGFHVAGNGAPRPSGVDSYLAATSASQTPLVVSGFTGSASTVDLFKIQDWSTDRFIVTSAGNVSMGGSISIGGTTTSRGTIRFGNTTYPGFNGYITEASTNSQLYSAFARNLIGSTGSTYTIVNGENGNYAGFELGNAEIRWFAASGAFTTGQSITPVERMRLSAGGNLLLKSDGVDSTNGRIQLATHTTISGGIGFGTDTSIWRNFANQLTTSAGTLIGNGGGIGYFSITTTASAPLVLGANGVESLRIDGSTQNAVFSKDILLGTNGPSVPSTLSGRAPRQGLVFNRTFGVNVANVVPFGTGDFTVAFWVRRDSSTAQQYLIGNDVTGCFYTGFRVNGNIFSGPSPGTANADLPLGTPTGRLFHLVLVRSAGVITGYVNAVAGGTTADTNNYTTSANSLFAADGAGNSALDGFGAVQGFYNRALTQDEVRRLYESGVIAIADINSASNTSLLTGANSDFSSVGDWVPNPPANISGGKLNLLGTHATNNGVTLRAGKRYRLVCTIDSITAGFFAVFNGVSYLSVATAAGAVSYEFNVAATTLLFVRCTGGDAVVDNMFIYPIGAVLAPDATQTGVNLKWWDTSGNAAHITLPANGVSWNVPASGNLAVNGYEGLSLDTNGSATLRYQDNGVTKWWIYKLQSDNNLYFRDMANARMQLQMLPGVTSDNAISTFNSKLDVGSTISSTVNSNSGVLQLNLVNSSTGTSASSLFRFNAGTRTASFQAYNDTHATLAGQLRIATSNGDISIIPSGVPVITFSASTTTIANQLDLNAGTAAAPSLKLNNTNNGLYYTGSNIVRIAANGTEAATFSATAATLTGTLAAGSGQHVFGNAAATAQLRVQRTTTTPSSVQINAIASFANIDFGSEGGGFTFGAIRANDTEILRIYNANLAQITNVSGGGLAIGGGLRVSAQTASTDTTSGAAVISGGVGVAGAIFAGGNIQCNAVYASNNTTLFLRPQGATISAGQAQLSTTGDLTLSGTVVDPAITGTILEDIFTITDAAAFEVDPGNGSIQLITLGASRTPKATNFAAGESVTMMIDDGTAFTLTWTDATWGTGGVKWVGGSAPTLATTGYTVIQLWKVGTQVYGARVGDVV